MLLFRKYMYVHFADPKRGSQMPDQRMKKVNNFDRQNIKIKVLLGQDVVPYRKSFRKEDADS